MIYYFVGTDTYGANLAISKFIDSKKTRLRWIDHIDLEDKSLAQWLEQAGGGFFEKETIVVRDPSSMSKVIQEQIVEVLKVEPVSHCIIWDRGKYDKRSSLYRFLKKYLQEFPIPSNNDLTKWLIIEARNREAFLDEGVARELIQAVGGNRWQLLREIEKLSLAHKQITIEVIRKLVVPNVVEPEVFAMLDALVVGNKKGAVKIMEELLTAGSGELYILSMLAYQFRTLLAIKKGLVVSQIATEVAQNVGLHPYVVKKNMEIAKNISQDDLMMYLTKIMATDFAIKQGKVDARTGLVMTMIGIKNPT